jgi:hypothetical protein
MAKSRYCPEKVKVILEAIRSHGSDRAGFEAAQLHKTTFYTWLKKYPEFAACVARAKEDYRNLSPLELNKQAKFAFADYLYGRVKEVWTTRREIYKIVDGEMKLNECEVTTREISRGIPKWAIERQLGTYDWVDAIKTLISANILQAEAIEEIQDLLGNEIVTSIQSILSHYASAPQNSQNN